jgi:hypothetical protein
MLDLLLLSSCLVLRFRLQRGVGQFRAGLIERPVSPREAVRAVPAKKCCGNNRSFDALLLICEHMKHWMEDSAQLQRSRARHAVWCHQSGLSLSGSRSTATETHEHDALILNNAITTKFVAVYGFEVSFPESQACCTTGSFFAPPQRFSTLFESTAQTKSCIALRMIFCTPRRSNCHATSREFAFLAATVEAACSRHSDAPQRFLSAQPR